ncbi:MAG: beta-lactamase family protein [Flavobacteriia bacterium]|nr:beta-lactamase family protein [Flavobacteriia bacterium]
MKKPISKIKRASQIFWIGGGLASLYFVPWIIVKAWIMPLPESIPEQLEEGLDMGFGGLIAYVEVGEQAGESYAAGWHNPALKTPAKPGALFKIASISKLYVAVSVAKLVARGQLSLDASLASYFPELADRIEYSDQISLRMLVQHRSGIPSFTDIPDFWLNPPNNSQETLALVLDLPAQFKPGTDYYYSNTNYLLLRELLDQTLGYSHHEFVKKEILQPLSLDHTYMSLQEVDSTQIMSGFHVGYTPDLKTEGDAMFATAEDVGLFIRALNNGSVFESEKEAAIYKEIYVYEHTGLMPGYQSIASYEEDLDAVVVLFSNTTDFEGYEWNLGEIIHSRMVKILRKTLE